jgi:hypothetical protein
MGPIPVKVILVAFASLWTNHLVVRVDPRPMASGPCEVADSAITLRPSMLDGVTDTTVDISRADE